MIPDLQLPAIPDGWIYFSDWRDGVVAAIGALLISLIIIWWRQQSRHWFRTLLTTLLIAILFTISSYYIFQVPRYFVDCDSTIGCDGWRGFPQPIAKIGVVERVRDGITTYEERVRVAPIDFGFNLLILWLMVAGASVIWRLIYLASVWPSRSFRTKTLLILLVGILPWALLPRFLSPPQPTLSGESQRIANNAKREAEFVHSITGLWVQQLAIEDIRTAPDNYETRLCKPLPEEEISQICLRGYTYFYLPWRRYVVDLGPSGVTSCSLTQRELTQPCW